MPKTNGYWKGERGNGLWYSDNPAVFNVTKGKGVEFIDGRPNFSSWSKANIVFKPGVLDGTDNDFSKVYKQIQSDYNLPSRSAAERLLKELGLTPHHKSTTIIELIPTELHCNILHIGTASDLRR